MNFREIYESRPDQKEVGSSGYSRMSHLYDICRELDPSVIIESGTWKGNSSWLFRNACPEAYLYCYDVTFSNLMWRDDSPLTRYVEHDITKHVNPDWNAFLPEERLLFFDDHINQEQRLQWAHDNGFKYVVFDDNVPEEEAKTLKNPPVPTLQMIEPPDYVEGCTILPYLGHENRDTYLTFVSLRVKKG